MASITIQNVSKIFGMTRVLSNISLKIKDGEFVSLLGPSGCGKSTLLRMIAGLEPTQHGEISVGNKNVTFLPPAARDLAMVFQSYALYPHLSVYDNIAVPLRMRKLSSMQRMPLLGRIFRKTHTTEQVIQHEINDIAQALSLKELLKRKPGQLSGGQRQRVALARAMVRKPEAFLMDEPLSNLDAKLRIQTRSELSQLHRKLGSTFLYVTHDQTEALTMSDRIAVMMDGEILQFDTPEEIYKNPHDLRIAEFIGNPCINRLNGVVHHKQVQLNVIPANQSKDISQSLEVDAPNGSEVVMAFRAEDALLCSTEDANFKAHVTHLENLGSDILVYVKELSTSETLIVRCAPDQQHIDLGTLVGIKLKKTPFIFLVAGPRLLVSEVTKNTKSDGEVVSCNTSVLCVI